MPDINYILNKWWKAILLITILTTVLAIVIASILPKEYRATATVIPASSYAGDKSKIFNQNIQILYPNIGDADDLDRIIGTANLDTLYIAVAEQLNLKHHYKVDKNPALFYAIDRLRKNTKVLKSEYGELKISVWDEDRNMCAAIANALLQQLQRLNQQLQGSSNALVLQKIKEDYAKLQQQYTSNMDSSKTDARLAAIKTGALQEQLKQYEKLIAEYSLTINTNTPALLVAEPARPPFFADRPDVVKTGIIAFFASAVFSFLLALLVEGKRKEA